MPTLEQIQAKLKKLQAQADVLIARKAQVAVDQIRDLMLKHGLTTADIEARAKARRTLQGLNGHAGNASAKVAKAGKASPKYRDHKTGATWTGHGRAPAWIASVKDRTQFLIEGASALTSAAKAGVTATKRGKGQPKGAQPAKYLNPKTGATWSGRGPAPAWLASVRDRTKFLIDSATAAAGDTGQKVATRATAKAGNAKAAGTSGAVSKKASAKKVVAKKAVAKKAARKVTASKASTASHKVTARKSAANPATKKTSAKSTAVKAPRKSPGRKAAAKAVTPATPAPEASTTQASA